MGLFSEKTYDFDTPKSIRELDEAVKKMDPEGGGTKTYSGTDTPDNSLGNNGDIYYQYETYSSDNLIDAVENLAMTDNTYTDTYGFKFSVEASDNYLNETYGHPYEAFDGIVGTRGWHPNSGANHWICLKFPLPVCVKAFTMYNRTGNVEHPSDFIVQGSNDGENFDDLVRVTWTEYGQGLHKDVEIPEEKQDYYRFFRIYILATSGSYGVIGEIKFNDVHVIPGTDDVITANYTKLNGKWLRVY